MNREIKFRAWDKRFEKMDYGKGDLLLRINEIDFSEPMQYTGLKDRTGKEIYEGDIVKILGVDDEVFEVVFNGSYLQFLFINKRMFQLPDFDELEVIGNIYENPELIIKK